MPWDWFVIDTSYVLVLVGGAMVLRVRSAPVSTWVAFGIVSAIVGAIVFYFTWDANRVFQEAAEAGDAVATLMAMC